MHFAIAVLSAPLGPDSVPAAACPEAAGIFTVALIVVWVSAKPQESNSKTLIEISVMRVPRDEAGYSHALRAVGLYGAQARASYPSPGEAF